MSKFILKVIGSIQLGVGLVAALYGPLEWHVLALFSRNGRFHYEGFGFGSLWFGLLIIQNISYYIITALLLPTGYATIRHRRWALPLSRLILWLWLGGGTIILLNLAVLTPAILQIDLARNVLLFRLGIVSALVIGGLIILPLLLLRFYRWSTITQAFTHDDAPPTWIERRPLPQLILFVLLIAVIIALHLAQFFQAMFPVFGRLVLGRAGAYLISVNVVLLGGLIWGVAKQQMWAWWGLLIYFSLFTTSTLLTFSRLTITDIITRMDLPEYELAFMANLTILQNYCPIWLLVVPLLAILGLLISIKNSLSTP